MKTYICKKCCNFGPGEPCVMHMDKDCLAPTFCPSDDGKYPGAEWEEAAQPAAEEDAESCCTREAGECILKDFGLCGHGCMYYAPALNFNREES